MRHRFGRRLGLHRSHDGIHVGNVHEQPHPGRVLRVDEGPDVGNPEGPKELFAPWRGKPMILVLHVVMGEYGRPCASSASGVPRPVAWVTPYTDMPDPCIDMVVRMAKPRLVPETSQAVSSMLDGLICEYVVDQAHMPRPRSWPATRRHVRRLSHDNGCRRRHARRRLGVHHHPEFKSEVSRRRPVVRSWPRWRPACPWSW